MSHPRFPLPEEDAYYFGRVAPLTGTEEIWLTVAQRNLNVRWRFRDVMASGHMDAATSAAICVVQEQIGHKPDGRLDEQTWDAIFTQTKRTP